MSSPSSIQIFRTIPPLRQTRQSLLLSSQSLALVPTMGALHSGHISLARLAAKTNPHVWLSIYVNPTQFAVYEDLDTYPSTFSSDLLLLEQLNKELESSGEVGRVTAVFAPGTKEMYPTLPPSSELDGDGSFVTITPLGKLLEGKSRPVFFRGVATVCMKLFNIVKPEEVYFGQKDVQQTVVINRMVKDFHIDTKVIVGSTEREKDGLAKSSRNTYLGQRRRNVGIVLYEALKRGEEVWKDGEPTRDKILEAATGHAERKKHKQLGMKQEERVLFEVDYISLADPETMEEIDVVRREKGAILSGAIKMLPLEIVNSGEDSGLGDGSVPVRLIDNIILPPT